MANSPKATRGAPDYYKVLGVSRNASEAELRRAYREQALRYHPDKNPENVEYATAQFKLVGQAYSVLKDSKLRAAYDARMAGGGYFVEGLMFSFEQASKLFTDVFGPDVAEKVGRAAAGVNARLTTAVSGTCDNILTGIEKEMNTQYKTLKLKRKAVADATLNLENQEKACQEAARKRISDSDAAAQRFNSALICASIAFILCALSLCALSFNSLVPCALVLKYCGDDFFKCQREMRHMRREHTRAADAESDARLALERELRQAQDALVAQNMEFETAQRSFKDTRYYNDDLRANGLSFSNALHFGSCWLGAALGIDIRL
eukprot:TRINITY_DN13428_c0_g1_i1.p1 TRINITY_DN13428_c0_g1~~TRINITY_DN13428_c0_g1_i1.p1  ORF type:complete len:320 (+),score=41.51 TRINITY_DN13428_c0_g1_i1:76-1035(+)